MVDLVEDTTYPAGIYQIETVDAVEGGAGGVSNRQALALAKRTAWLKSQQELHAAAVDPHPQYMTAAESDALIAAAVAALVAASPAALDTLNELATALNNDPNFATTMTNALAAKTPWAVSDAIITFAGLTPDHANPNQLLTAISSLIEARVGDYSIDTGAANAYVISLNPVIAVYTGNLSGSFKAANANNGASTLNAGGGVVPLVNDAGGALADGDIKANSIVNYDYVHADGKAYITSIVQSQADVRYLKKSGGTMTGTLIGTVTPLVSAAGLIAVDLALTNNFKHTMTENTLLTAPSNAVEGTSGQIAITQHASAAKTMAFNANWVSSDGTVPALSTTPGAVNLLTYYVVDATHIWFSLSKHGVA